MASIVVAAAAALPPSPSPSPLLPSSLQSSLVEYKYFTNAFLRERVHHHIHKLWPTGYPGHKHFVKGIKRLLTSVLREDYNLLKNALRIPPRKNKVLAAQFTPHRNTGRKRPSNAYTLFCLLHRYKPQPNSKGQLQKTWSLMSTQQTQPFEELAKTVKSWTEQERKEKGTTWLVQHMAGNPAFKLPPPRTALYELLKEIEELRTEASEVSMEDPFPSDLCYIARCSTWMQRKNKAWHKRFPNVKVTSVKTVQVLYVSDDSDSDDEGDDDPAADLEFVETKSAEADEQADEMNEESEDEEAEQRTISASQLDPIVSALSPSSSVALSFSWIHSPRTEKPNDELLSMLSPRCPQHSQFVVDSECNTWENTSLQNREKRSNVKMKC